MPEKSPLLFYLLFMLLAAVIDRPCKGERPHSMYLVGVVYTTEPSSIVTVIYTKRYVKPRV